MKDKTTAALLAFILGGFGIHKFYLNRSGQGIIYLLFCWTFIPAIIAFFETFYYLLMSDQEFSRKYNQNHQHALPGPQPGQNQMGQNVTINMQDGNVAEELHKLNELRMAGALTDEEFQAQKRRLLS